MHVGPKITAIDLFCGAGGLTNGLESTGISVVAGVDVDPACKHAFSANNNAAFYEKDVATLEAEWLETHFADAEFRFLVGCAPCQPFSTLNRDRGASDDRWSLVETFSKLVREVLPDVVSMENVPSLEKREVFKAFVTTLLDAGYLCSWSIVKCEEIGLPQKRRRLVLLASRLGEITWDADRAMQRTVGDAIGGLRALSDGEADPDDAMHKAATLSEVNRRRIRASRQGGTWRDWPKELRLPCHLRETGSRFPSPYGRLDETKPAMTITTACTTYGCGRFGHPTQDRGLTPREAALLQGFPPDYSFFPGACYSASDAARLVGNAVPPPLGAAIGRLVQTHAKRYDR